MAKQKDDRATLELDGLAKPIGRPKGVKAPLTAAEKMRAYRERKAKSGVKSIELTEDERVYIYIAVSLYKPRNETDEECEKRIEILKKIKA